MEDYSTVGYCLEGGLVLMGLLVLLVHWVRRKSAADPVINRLPVRNTVTADLLFFALALIVPMGLGGVAAMIAAKYHPEWGLGKIQLGATYLQEFAMIAAIVLYVKFGREPDPVPAEPLPKLPAVKTGVLTFLAAMPVVFLVAAAWQGLLTLCNFPPSHQTIVDLFLGLDTWIMQTLFMIVAAVLVPFCEEMIFRGGLFRGLRASLPRPYAILVSAVIFGAAHWDITSFLPLVTLGVVFAIAYERTGNIGTVIIAHALFNLNTLVALLLGVNA